MPNQMEEMEATYGGRAMDKMTPMKGGAPDENPEASATDSFSMLQEALFNLNSAVQGSPKIPPEGQKALDAALSAYNQFMTIAGEAMGLPMAKVQQGEMGPRGEEVVAAAPQKPRGMEAVPGA